MKFLSLFAGIGGFDLGLERAGMQCVGQVEIDPKCQLVLAKHWPNVKRMGDIRNVKGDEFGSVDLVCGGFPCQPFSTAGKRKGKEDDRYLWPEMLRVISLYKPAWIVGENVGGIIGVELDTVLSQMESIGYEVQPLVIPACAVGAPHRRDRIWILANSVRNGFDNINAASNGNNKRENYYNFIERENWDIPFTRLCKNVPNTNIERLEREISTRIRPGQPGLSSECCQWPAEPGLGRVAHGIPTSLDGALRRFKFDTNNTKAISTIDNIRKQILSNMWSEQHQIEPTPLRTECIKNSHSMYEMSYLVAHEKWNLGQRIKSDSDLYNMWNEIHSKGLSQSQDLFRKMLERIREIERNEKVGSSRTDRVKQLGNAVVPQIPEIIGRAIIAVSK